MVLLVNGACLIDRPTGIATYTLNLLPHLQPLDPILLSAKPQAGLAHHAIAGNMSPDSGGQGHLRRLFWTQFQVPHLQQKLGADLLFSPIPEGPLGTRQRYAVMLHDLIPLRFPNPRSPLTYYSRYYVPRVLAGAEKVLCNSAATARDAVDYYGVPASKLVPTLLACDRERFRPDPEAQRSNYFLYIGRLDPYKNLARAIEALGQVRDRDCELWIVGPPDPRFVPELQARARAVGVEGRVKFLGYTKSADLPKLLQQALALVFVSLWEGFGLPLLEALACGTPAIASNISSLPEVAGDAALLVDPYNVGAITEAMNAVVEDGALRDRLSAAGIARATEFSWERTGRETQTVLASLL